MVMDDKGILDLQPIFIPQRKKQTWVKSKKIVLKDWQQMKNNICFRINIFAYIKKIFSSINNAQQQ